MLNDEVGTYPIAQALEVNNELPLYQLDDRKVQVELNGKLVTGNTHILHSLLPDVKLNITQTIESAEVYRKRDAEQILEEEYGIVYEDEWLECMEDPNEIWREAQLLADVMTEAEEKEDYVEEPLIDLDDGDEFEITF